MRPFTKAQFRLLLVFYCLLVIASLLAYHLKGDAIPATVIQAEEVAHEQWFSSFRPFAMVAFIVLLMGIILAALVGLTGMFLLWRPSRYIFLGAVVFRVFGQLVLLPWLAQTRIESFIDEIGVFFDAFIIVSVFFGPAKELFARKTDSDTPLNRSRTQ